MDHPSHLNRRACLGFAMGLATDLALARDLCGLAVASPGTPPGNVRFRYEVVHHFKPGEGARPLGGITIASDGNWYGTNGSEGRDGFGTLFRIDNASNLETLHDFAGPPDDGSRPSGALVEGGDGALYGTTALGGSGAGVGGTNFRIARDGGEFAILHDFPSSPDDGDAGGALDADGGQKHPSAGVIEGADGRLYGTTEGGGTQNPGGIYGLAKDGSDFRSLHIFRWTEEGAEPFTELTQGSDGMLYGGTRWGGANNSGTLFRLHLGGRLTVLHVFDSSVDGWGVGSPLLEIQPGVFLGTTVNGGPVFPGHGTAFMIRLPVAPSVLIQFTDCGVPGRSIHARAGIRTLRPFAGRRFRHALAPWLRARLSTDGQGGGRNCAGSSATSEIRTSSMLPRNKYDSPSGTPGMSAPMVKAA